MATSFDISEFIDSRPVGKYQLKILVTCLIAALLDGFDMQVAGLAIPVLERDWHLAPKAFSSVLMAGPIGMVFGSAIMGPLADRFGGFKVMAGNYILGALAVLALGAADTGAIVLIPALFVTGTCVMGSQIAMYAIAAAVYPTAIRATGVGTTIGIGRTGSIVGPMAGAAAVALGWSIPAIFAMASVSIFLASFSINLMGSVPKNFGVTNGT